MKIRRKANSYPKINLLIAHCQIPFAYCFPRHFMAGSSLRLILLTACCLLFFFFPASAQHTIMRSFNINDGLVSNQVRGFYQDRNGFIWVMTWEGLSRYDGYSFRNYTLAEGLSHPLINALFEIPDGSIYISENDGSVDVMVQGEIQRELSKKYEQPFNQFIPDSSSGVLAPSDGLGIFVFDKGIFKSLNTTKTQITVNGVISFEDYFIVAGSKSGVMRHDHTFIKEWHDTEINYKCILKDNFRRIWVGTSIGLKWVNTFGNKSDRFDLVKTPYENLPWSHWDINDIIQASDGSIWIAAFGGMIQIKRDQTWRIYNRRDGLPNDNITSVFEDKDGFIWIGTDQGMSQLDIKNSIDIFTVSEDLPNSIVTDILPIRNDAAYMVANTPAVYKIKVGQPGQSIIKSGFSNGYRFLRYGTDTIVSTPNTFYKVSNSTMSLWTDVPYSRMAVSLVVDSTLYLALSGKITIATSIGIFTDTSFHDQIYVMAHDPDDFIWIGSLNEGVFKIKVKSNSAGITELEWHDMNRYIPEKTIRSLHTDAKGNIWVGTRYSGLVWLKKDSLNEAYTARSLIGMMGLILIL